MLTKSYTASGRLCRVTFRLPPGTGAHTVALCGEFNDWDPACHTMRPLPGGGFAISLFLNAARRYRFRYLLDGQRWEVDGGADGIASSSLGGEDSIVTL